MQAHANRVHASLAPSAAARWMACPGSVVISAGLTEAPSQYANEGTAAHMLAERCLGGGTDADHWLGFTVDTQARYGNDPWFRPGHKGGKPNGITVFEVDQEMAESVQLYLEVARATAEQAEEFEVEQRLDLSDLIDGCFGTGDFVAYLGGDRRLVVGDLKYGKGVAVDAEENKQLLTYALALAKRYHNRPVDEIELVIVQPRAPHRLGPVRRYVTSLVGLYEHAMALQDAARRIVDPDAPRIPGSHCKFCKAAAICEELVERVFELTGAYRNIMGVLEVADPAKYDSGALAQYWRDREIVLNWCKSVEKFAHAEAMAGKHLPGLKLVRKDKHRVWKDEENTAITLEVFCGMANDDIYERKMRSPAQLEKLIPKDERADFMAAHAEKPVSKETVLAEIDDPRPVFNPGDASGFEAVEVE